MHVTILITPCLDLNFPILDIQMTWSDIAGSSQSTGKRFTTKSWKLQSFQQLLTKEIQRITMTIQKQTGNVNQHFLRHFTCGVTCVGTYNGTSTLPLPNHNDFLMQYFYYPILPLNLTHLCEDVLHILSPFRQGSVFFPNSDTGCPTFVTLCI